MTRKQGSDSHSAEELEARILDACTAALDVFTIHLGRMLGLYRALQDRPLSSHELAEQTSTNERYVREWLEQQAVTGILTVDDERAPAHERRFALPPGYAEALLDHDSLKYVGPLASMTAVAGSQLGVLGAAFQSGSGVPAYDFDDEMRTSQGDTNRPMYLQRLAREWLASDPVVDAILSRDVARVADIGTGFGWSAIAIAEHYPGVAVVGVDVDQPSIDAASTNAIDRGVADRVTFTSADLSGFDEDTFDLVIACECIHDMPDPISVLSHARSMVKGDGVVLILDERTHDEFTSDAGDAERLNYGFSVTTCLPDAMAHTPSVATGAVMRRSTLEAYARSAGFDAVGELPIDHDRFRMYRLT